jgi:hypothetical protein
MKAAAIDHFGGPEVLGVKSLAVPTPRIARFVSITSAN